MVNVQNFYPVLMSFKFAVAIGVMPVLTKDQIESQERSSGIFRRTGKVFFLCTIVQSAVSQILFFLAC